MSRPTVETLRAEMPVRLREVARAAAGRPALVVTDWAVTQLSNQGVMNTQGLFRFSGSGTDDHGTAPWAAVLKVVADRWPDVEPWHLWNASREADVVRSGLLETLPDDSVRAPRCYATEVVDGTNWLWLELVDEVPGRWGADDFVHVARRLGRFNGMFLEPRTPLPEPSWSRDLLRTWCVMLAPTGAWEHPTVTRFFSPALRRQVEQLWDARTSLFDALEHLPQSFVHADTHRRNLLLEKDRRSEPVLIDWALCGIGPVGSDLSALVAGSAFLQELDLDQVAAIEADASAAYSAGLDDAGCTLHPRLVRLGWTAWTGTSSVPFQWNPIGTTRGVPSVQT